MQQKQIRKRYFTLFTILFLYLTALNVKAQTETYSWSNVAIGGGGFVSGIVTSKTEQGLMYCRTDVGGAYRWDAANSKWVPLLDWISDNEVGYLGVEAIAIDPVETNKVYMLVGTSYFNNGKTAILRSDNYGNSFSITDVTSQFKAHGNGMGRQTGEKLVVDPNNTSILLCGTRANGLFKSTNAGVSWSKVSTLSVSTTPNANGISFVVLDPSSGTPGSATQTIIVGVSRTGTNLYRSDDGGATFTEITSAPSTLMPHRAVLASNGNLFITYANNAGPWDITGAGAIWKYNLGSGAWTNVTPATGFTGAYGGISVDPANPDRLVASSLNSYWPQDNSYGDRIFLTINGGSSWTDIVDRGFDLDANGSPWIDGNAIHWAGCVEFDPFDTKKAWVISGNGVFSTDDIDATTNVWKFNVKGLEETVPLDIVSVANGPLVSVIGDYDGFRHTDVSQYGPIHTPKIGTTSGIAVAALNPYIMLRVGYKMFYSVDKGISWTECTINGENGKVAISADGSVFLHNPENSSTTYRSLDKGATWTTVSGLTINGAIPVADPINPDKFYAYNSNNGSILISTNGGVSFSASGSPGSGGSKIIRLAPLREGDIWVPLYGNGLTRSVNSGQDFTKISGVTYCGAVGFGKEAPGQSYPAVYIWGTVGGVLGIHRSVDEGATWERINDDDHEYGGPGNGQFVIGDMNVYGRVYMSTAGRGIVYGESDQTCIPTWIVPNIKVNSDASQEVTMTSVSQGATVLLSPEPASGGTWSWTGPGGFTSASREVSLASIDGSDAGIYIAHYTDPDGCESGAQTFTVNVLIKATGIIIKGEGDATSIDEKGGTLQLVAEFTPANTTDQSVTWSITGGSDLATLSSDGILTATDDGIVTVRATANDGSDVFGEVEITITNQVVTAIEETVDSRFGVYPNPVDFNINIRNANNLKQVTVRNAQGQLIKAIPAGKNSIVIPMSDLVTGMYIMELTDIHNRTYFKKVVKH